jgi:hypothetical protein
MMKSRKEVRHARVLLRGLQAGAAAVCVIAETIEHKPGTSDKARTIAAGVRLMAAFARDDLEALRRSIT